MLQDSVILRKQFPSHPLWKDSLFNFEEYQRFAAQAENSLVNLVTPEELLMQKYWPAQEATAKLRHDAIVSEINSVRFGVQSILNRLDQMERSTASFAPIWVQQGNIRTWMVPTEAAHPNWRKLVPQPTAHDPRMCSRPPAQAFCNPPAFNSEHVDSYNTPQQPLAPEPTSASALTPTPALVLHSQCSHLYSHPLHLRLHRLAAFRLHHSYLTQVHHQCLIRCSGAAILYSNCGLSGL